MMFVRARSTVMFGVRNRPRAVRAMERIEVVTEQRAEFYTGRVYAVRNEDDASFEDLLDDYAQS